MPRVSAAENITATEEEVSQAWEQMAVQYGMPVEQVRQYAPPETEQEIRADLIQQKAYALLRESTILDPA